MTSTSATFVESVAEDLLALALDENESGPMLSKMPKVARQGPGPLPSGHLRTVLS